MTQAELLMAMLLLRTAWEMRAGLRNELGRRASNGCAVPTLVIGLLFAVRRLHVQFFVNDQLGLIAATTAAAASAHAAVDAAGGAADHAARGGLNRAST